jgi:hypothetical protein
LSPFGVLCHHETYYPKVDHKGLAINRLLIIVIFGKSPNGGPREVEATCSCSLESTSPLPLHFKEEVLSTALILASINKNP